MGKKRPNVNSNKYLDTHNYGDEDKKDTQSKVHLRQQIAYGTEYNDEAFSPTKQLVVTSLSILIVSLVLCRVLWLPIAKGVKPTAGIRSLPPNLGDCNTTFQNLFFDVPQVVSVVQGSIPDDGDVRAFLWFDNCESFASDDDFSSFRCFNPVNLQEPTTLGIDISLVNNSFFYSSNSSALTYPQGTLLPFAFNDDNSIISQNNSTVTITHRPHLLVEASLSTHGRSSRILDKKSYGIKILRIISESSPSKGSSAFSSQLKGNKIMPLGMPAGRKWILQAPFLDRSLLRDVLAPILARQMGQYAPRTRFLELFLHIGSTPPPSSLGSAAASAAPSPTEISRIVAEAEGGVGKGSKNQGSSGGSDTMDDANDNSCDKKENRKRKMGREYRGLYFLTEKVSQGKNRVNVRKSSSSSSSSSFPSLTRGLIFEMNNEAAEEWYATSRLQILSPPIATLGPTRVDLTYPRSSSDASSIARSRVQDLNSRIFDEGEWSTWKDPMVRKSDEYQGNRNMISNIDINNHSHIPLESKNAMGGILPPQIEKILDLDSWIDFFLHTELTKDYDGFVSSVFMNVKDTTASGSESKFRMGPSWDKNLAFGNEQEVSDPSGWRYSTPAILQSGIAAKWFKKLLSSSAAFRYAVRNRWFTLRAGKWSDKALEKTVDKLASAVALAAERNYDRWMINTISSNTRFVVLPVAKNTWTGEVNELKSWLMKRMAWIDGQLRTADGFLTGAANVKRPIFRTFLEG